MRQESRYPSCAHDQHPYIGYATCPRSYTHCGKTPKILEDSQQQEVKRKERESGGGAREKARQEGGCQIKIVRRGRKAEDFAPVFFDGGVKTVTQNRREIIFHRRARRPTRPTTYCCILSSSYAKPASCSPRKINAEGTLNTT